MTLSRLLAVGFLLGAATPAFAQPKQMASQPNQMANQPKQMESVILPGPAADHAHNSGDEVAIGKDIGDRMTVEVRVAGKGPYRFLVDTGAERTVISRQLARRLNLESGQVTKLHSVVGVNHVDTVYIPRLTVSSNTISVVDAPALEAAHIGADGMLGIDSLHAQRVMFDFKAKTMSITQANVPPEKVDGDTIVVRARSKKGRLIFTDARIDGRDVTVIIDTGSQVTIGNRALQRSLARAHMWRAPNPTEIVSVTGERMQVQIVLVNQLQLDGLHLSNLAVAFADAHIFRQLKLDNKPALLLGMNAMRAFDRISIDFAAKKVRFVLPGSSRRNTFRLAELEER